MRKDAAMLMKIWNSPYTFWLLLALPSFGMIAGAFSGDDLEHLLHPTGEFAARFMIIAMMLTPLKMLFPKSRPLSDMLLNCPSSSAIMRTFRGCSSASVMEDSAGRPSGMLILKSPSGSMIFRVNKKKISSWNTTSIIGVICDSILSPPGFRLRIFIRRKQDAVDCQSKAESLIRSSESP